MDTFLALCARAQGHPTFYHQLQARASQFAGWDDLPHRAEHHGLGPLAYAHLNTAQAHLPAATRRKLQGLALRHRQANAVRSVALKEVLGTFYHAGIEVLLLKGAALAHTVYPRPGLRPMRDLDLLVSKSQVGHAQRLLADLGYTAPLPSPGVLPSKHLEAAGRTLSGLHISIELHHNLFHNTRHHTSLEIENLRETAISFNLDNTPAFTLGYEDMLWHIYQHAFGMPHIHQPVRLVWVADLVSMVEKFIAQIDWSLVQKKYPRVLNILPLLHPMTPWSDTVLQTLNLDIKNVPQGAGTEFQGWPRNALTAQQEKGFFGILKDTFFPPKWWLRLYYGTSPGVSSFWSRWMYHPLHVLEWVLHYLTGKSLRPR